MVCRSVASGIGPGASWQRWPRKPFYDSTDCVWHPERSGGPSSLTLAAGATQSFTVTITRTTASLNAYTGGQLTWEGSGYLVRSPIVVRPVAAP